MIWFTGSVDSDANMHNAVQAPTQDVQDPPLNETASFAQAEVPPDTLNGPGSDADDAEAKAKELD